MWHKENVNFSEINFKKIKQSKRGKTKKNVK